MENEKVLQMGFGKVNGLLLKKEIDFVAEKQGGKLYVQVCSLLSEEATVRREFYSLLEVRDNYPKIVLYKEGF